MGSHVNENETIVKLLNQKFEKKKFGLDLCSGF